MSTVARVISTVVGVAGVAMVAGAQPGRWEDGLSARPARNISFVRSYDNRVAFEDWSLADMLDAQVGIGKRFASVDVVMQQCFGGGFVEAFRDRASFPHTIVSASAWYETAWSVREFQSAPVGLWNFTTEWIDAARAGAGTGMLEVAATARANDVAGPISGRFNPIFPEHPQYSSSGDDQDLRPFAPNGQSRLFTVIGEFGRTDRLALRHDINLARVHALGSQVGSPDRVASLSQAAGLEIPAAGQWRPFNEELPAVTITGSTSQDGVINALSGGNFADQSSQPGDRLLFYATGHGARGVFNEFGFEPRGEGPDGLQRAIFAVSAFGGYEPQQRDAGGPPFETFNANMYGDGDESGVNEIQVHLTSMVDFAGLGGSSGVDRLLLNGLDVTSLLRVVTGDDIRALPRLDAGMSLDPAAMVVQFDLPYEFFNDLGPRGLEFEVRADSLSLLTPSLMQGVGLWAGDREIVAVNVPSPAGPLVLAALVITRRRRRG